MLHLVNPFRFASGGLDLGEHVQLVRNAGTSTTPSATLGANTSLNNLLLAFLKTGSIESEIAANTGWTLLAELQHSGAAFSVAIAARQAAASTASYSPFTTANDFYDLLLVEDTYQADWSSGGSNLIADTSAGSIENLTDENTPGVLENLAAGMLCANAVALNASSGGGWAATSGFSAYNPGSTFAQNVAAIKRKTDSNDENSTLSWTTGGRNGVGIGVALNPAA